MLANLRETSCEAILSRERVPASFFAVIMASEFSIIIAFDAVSRLAMPFSMVAVCSCSSCLIACIEGVPPGEISIVTPNRRSKERALPAIIAVVATATTIVVREGRWPMEMSTAKRAAMKAMTRMAVKARAKQPDQYDSRERRDDCL